MSSSWSELPVAAHPPAPPRRLWRDALRLMLGWQPARPAQPLGIGALLVVIVVFLAAGLIIDDLSTPFPRWWNPWAATDRSFPVLLALLLALVCASALGRAGIAVRAAATGLLALTPALTLWPLLSPWLEAWRIPDWAAAAYVAWVVIQTVRWIARGSRPRLAWGAALGAAAAAVIAVQTMSFLSWWWPDDEDEEAYWEEPAPAFSAERVWNAQPGLVDDALAGLAAQRPGVVDLYAITMAGDGSESVFRNEVSLFRSTLEQRFGANGRVLSLVNHPDTHDTQPLASVSNLRRSLAGVAALMDRDEDVLLLFVTSHGSADHEILLDLDPLPLDQLDPPTLSALLEEAGIRWRVLVLSACYSGGFVEPLKAPETLVITAARADRTSFGCGADSEITWFGHAFIEEAMHRTTDFFEAFRLAKAAIQQREGEEGIRASLPQMARGSDIGAKLEAWRRDLPAAVEVD